MTARGAMKLRATVDRWSATDAKGWGGQPVRRDERIHDALPCQYWVRNLGNGLEVDNVKTSVIRRSYLMVPIGSDIAEGDLIAAVVNRRGEPAHMEFGPDETIRVNRILPRRNHLQIDLESYHGS